MSYVFEGSNFVIYDLRQEIQKHINANFPYGWRSSGAHYYRRELDTIKHVVYHHTAGGMTPGLKGPINTAEYSVRDPRFKCPQCGRCWLGNKSYPHSFCPLCKTTGKNTGYGNGFPGMPYHVFVPYDPELTEQGKHVVFWCEDFEEVTWHSSKGNAQGVSVAWQGLFKSRHLNRFIPWPNTDGDPSPAQKQLVVPLWEEWLRPEFELANSDLTGHYAFGKPSCPGDWIENKIRQVNQEPALNVYDTSHFNPEEEMFGSWTLRQAALVVLGYDLGAYGPLKNGVDGKPGMKTKMAIAAFEDANNLIVDGVWDDQVEHAMFYVFFDTMGLTQSTLIDTLSKEMPTDL